MGEFSQVLPGTATTAWRVVDVRVDRLTVVTGVESQSKHGSLFVSIGIALVLPAFRVGRFSPPTLTSTHPSMPAFRGSTRFGRRQLTETQAIYDHPGYGLVCSQHMVSVFISDSTLRAAGAVRRTSPVSASRRGVVDGR